MKLRKFVAVAGNRLFKTRTGRVLLVLSMLVFMWNFDTLKARADAGDNWGAWFFSAILGGMQSFWGWLMGLLGAILTEVLSWFDFTDVMAGIDAQSWTAVTNWVNVINYWFPLDTLVAAVAAYIVWSVTLAVARIAKSFVPLISG